MSINQIRDALFEKSFGNKEVIKDFLRGRLDKDMLDDIHIDSVERQDTTFMSEAFKSFQNAVLYRVETKGDGGYVYFLVQAQYTPYSLLAFRMLEYDVSIMRHHIEQELKAGKPKKDIKVPRVLNFFLYCGKEKYTYATGIIDGFANKDLAKLIFGL